MAYHYDVSSENNFLVILSMCGVTDTKQYFLVLSNRNRYRALPRFYFSGTTIRNNYIITHHEGSIIFFVLENAYSSYVRTAEHLFCDPLHNIKHIRIINYVLTAVFFFFFFFLIPSTHSNVPSVTHYCSPSKVETPNRPIPLIVRRLYILRIDCV